MHNSVFDWVRRKVSGWSPTCHAQCLQSALSPGGRANSTSSPASDVPNLSAVPVEYHDLQEVFSKSRALSLPPHRHYDCSIDLLPGAPLPSSHLYNLSKPERETMEEYIRNSLAASIIRPSSSPVGAGFFFVTKKDKTLHPCIDYRGLNNITVKKQIPTSSLGLRIHTPPRSNHLFQARPTECVSPGAHKKGG
ncbi:hypothetical protein NQD34_007855 [Periophthalmus magnuspinnatus]|nr:hypothetical protein NQD34_007855 [Periophthalmus magnuspinnatus]